MLSKQPITETSANKSYEHIAPGEKDIILFLCFSNIPYLVE